jgi:ketosteroid isomerase-like protein
MRRLRGALAWPPVRNPEAERFVGDVWSAFQREGVAGVFAYAADDAVWQPHSAGKRTFRSTAEYREYLANVPVAERFEASATGIWSHDDVVAVRGRMRISRDGGLLEDTRMYWLFAVAAGRLVRMGSSPDLAGLLREAGHDDPVLAREAFIALHRSGAIEPER